MDFLRLDFLRLWRRKEDSKKDRQQPSELRIATSGSFSIRATIEGLRVDGAGSYSQGGRVRAALFVPSTCTTVQFHGDNVKKPANNARASCVHVLQMFDPVETALILQDAQRIGAAIGWSDRGVSLPTQDVLVQNLSKESQDLVHKAIREQLLPFARRQYSHLNAAFDKQPYPRPGNLFIVRYSAASGRPGGRGLKLHKDETALTFNMCLSPQDGFEGGGTYFPAASSDVDGILLRPTPGYCLVHDGNIKHAGNEVLSGDRFILVGFYNADGRDRAGEEAFFSRKALEESRHKMLALPPLPVQTIYFTTAVAAMRVSAISQDSPLQQQPGFSCDASRGQRPHASLDATCADGDGEPNFSGSGRQRSSGSLFGQSDRRPLSSVAIQGPPIGEERQPIGEQHMAAMRAEIANRDQRSRMSVEQNRSSVARRELRSSVGASLVTAWMADDGGVSVETSRLCDTTRSVSRPGGGFGEPYTHGLDAAVAHSTGPWIEVPSEMQRGPRRPYSHVSSAPPCIASSIASSPRLSCSTITAPSSGAGAAAVEAARWRSETAGEEGSITEHRMRNDQEAHSGDEVASMHPPHSLSPTASDHDTTRLRATSALSCMPNWPLFQLIQGKSRARH